MTLLNTGFEESLRKPPNDLTNLLISSHLQELFNNNSMSDAYVWTQFGFFC